MKLPNFNQEQADLKWVRLLKITNAKREAKLNADYWEAVMRMHTCMLRVPQTKKIK